jgi:hypothetical protein
MKLFLLMEKEFNSPNLIHFNYSSIRKPVKLSLVQPTQKFASLQTFLQFIAKWNRLYYFKGSFFLNYKSFVFQQTSSFQPGLRFQLNIKFLGNSTLLTSCKAILSFSVNHRNDESSSSSAQFFIPSY